MVKPKIKRKGMGAVGSQWFGDRPSYCSDCYRLVHRFYRLIPRIYPEDQPIPSDAKNWLQCEHCGKIIPTYEGEKTSVIVPMAGMEPTETGWDLTNLHLTGTKKRGGKRGAIKKGQVIEQYNDPEVQHAVRKGMKVTGYWESQI